MDRLGRHGPSLPQLRALVAVADTLNFRDAAAVLGLTQPAVSSAIAGLEATLGTRLVERTTRRVILTPVGEDVARRAREILDAVLALVAAAHGAPERLGGRLRIGIIPTVAPYVLPAVAAGLAEQLPGVRPEVSEDQTARLMEALGRGTIDVAVLALPAGGSALTELPLYREDFLLALPAGHPLANRIDVPHTALADLNLLLLQEGHCLRDQVLDVCRMIGAPTAHPARAASLETLSRLVAGGLGTTLLPATAVTDALRGPVAVARLAEPVPGRTIGLVHRSTDGRAEEYAELARVLRDAVQRAGLPVRPMGGVAAAAS